MFAAVSRKQQSTVSLERFLSVFVALGILYVVTSRLVISATLPLWLDETWSAMIATRADWSSFWHEAWLDCNPPLYYLLLTGWVSLFGESNFMLRLPSTLLVVLAAALPLLWRPQGLGRSATWTFSALLILWQPGVEVVLDARGYGLMLCLSTASCLVVGQMLERLTLPRAAAWTALGSLMFLTHYYAAALILGQGAILLYRHRLDLFRIWPALPIAAPGLAWFLYHLPRLKDYARPDVAWYDPTTVETTLAHLLYVLGTLTIVSLAILVAIVVMAVLQSRRVAQGSADTALPADRNLALVAATGAIGFAVMIVVGVIQASLAHRYFTPLAPPVMLALALVAQRCARREIAGMLLAFSFLLPALNPQVTMAVVQGRAIYGYEEASDFVHAYKPDQLLFLWDHPATKIMEQGSLEGIGGYFLKRAGDDIPVRALVAPLTADSNALIRAAATGQRPALIWLYDTAHRSAAHDHPPTFEDDPAWSCRHLNRKTINSEELGSIACVKLGAGHD